MIISRSGGEKIGVHRHLGRRAEQRYTSGDRTERISNLVSEPRGKPTERSFSLGLVGCVQIAPLPLVSSLGGTAADAFDRRRLLVLVEIGMTLTCVGFALNTGAATPLWPIFVLIAINAGITGVEAPTRNAIIPSLVSHEQLPAAFALHQTLHKTAQVVGPALAGVLIALIGPGAAYLGAAGLCALCVVLVADLFLAEDRKGVLPSLAGLGLLAAVVPVLTLAVEGTDRALFGGAYALDRFGASIDSNRTVRALGSQQLGENRTLFGREKIALQVRPSLRRLAYTSSSWSTAARLDDLIAQNAEHEQMVAQLEEAVDSIGEGTTSDLPTGDELAEELQQFLREQGPDQ